MAELKQSRWVKIHEPGNANFDEKDNIMDIVIGSNRCQAEATFTVRSFRKAAYWLLKYLEAADALQIIATAADSINTQAAGATKEDDTVTVTGEGWTCEIERMNQGVFKVHMSWAVSELVTVKQPASRKKTAATKKSTGRGRRNKKAEDAA